MITLNTSSIAGAGTEALHREALKANELLHTGEGRGADFLGWVTLPGDTTPESLTDIKNCATRLRSVAEVVVVIGIGGSYLGAKAVQEALTGSFHYLHHKRIDPYVIYMGENLSEDYMAELLEAIAEYDIATIVISKSGTTTEPAIAFRLLKAEIERRYGKAGARERIVAITDEQRGALKTLATSEGYKTYIIPDNVGGRFSVLTPVGLLPLAVVGVDVDALIAGARDMEAATAAGVSYGKNLAAQYAVARNVLYNGGKKVEILGSYEPRLQYIAEWWKQLYGESEGKEKLGIFPAGVTYTADLHSMGQYIQEGERTLFETIISVENSEREVKINPTDDNLDGLNFLSGRRLGEVNRMAEVGVRLAHEDGGVPNIRISIERIDARHIGALLYFFEKACGISGYLLGVNPFDQPGVEAYKKNMFALLRKPGYEAETEAIYRRL